MRHPSGSALPWLGHPVTVIAVFVLLVNDHVLKGLWPGPVTGKLSDVAGLFVAPPLLALVRVPPLAATVATGVGFALVKSTEAGAALASHAWSLLAGPSRVLADPSDLAALPALGLAWLVWRRCRSGHAVRRARALIVVPVALVAVTATSQATPPPSAVSALADSEAITVFLDYDSHGKVVSRDGGRTWNRRPDPTSSPAPTPTPIPQGATSACLPDEPRHCYRVAPPRMAVDESLDGGTSWKTVWGVTPGREEVLRRHDDERHGSLWQGSSSLAVQSRPDGHVVVMTNGSDGIAVRDVRGTWRRLGFSAEGFSEEAATPLHAPDLDLTPEYVSGLFAGLLGFLLCLSMARRHERRVSGLSVAACLLASLGFVWSVTGFAPLVLLGLACAFLAVCLAATAAARSRVSVLAWLAPAVTAVCTALTIRLIFSGWSSGVPDDYSTATFLAWIVGGAGVVGSAAIGWRAARVPGAASAPAPSTPGDVNAKPRTTPE
ncbi:hypothetical protein, partial [Streptosporangium carneum]